MKLLVMSDTHGNKEFLCNILDREDGIETILHLGDNYEDIYLCESDLKKKKIYRVPGNYHPDLLSKKIERSLDFEFKGIVFRLIHDLQQLDNHKGCNYILFGHTHVAFCEEMKGRVYINPGHLKKITDRGQIASYGLFTIDNNIVIYENKRYDGKLNYSRSWKY